MLNWSTGMEINNNYFELEKSENSLNWVVVKKIEGQGNKHNLTNYLVMDKEKLSKYYRLKQVDFDGIIFYSNVIIIQKSNKIQLIGIYNTLGQEVDENSPGLIIKLYSNGDKKIINNLK
jgi:hypothetical protein